MKKPIDLLSLAAVAALGPAFLFPKPPAVFLCPVILVPLFVRAAAAKRILPKTPLDAAAAVLLLTALGSVLAGGDILGSSGKLAGLVYGIVVFYLLADALATEKVLKAAAAVFLAAGLLVGATGIIGRSAMKKDFFGGFERVLQRIPRADLGLSGAEKGVNPNALGGVLLLFVPLACVQAGLLARKQDYVRSKAGRVGAIAGTAAGLAVFFTAIILSHSFGVGLGALTALALLGERGRWVKGGIAVLLVAATVLIVSKPSPGGKSAGFDPRSTIRASATNRVKLWRVGYEFAASRPLTGIGLDQLRRTGRIKYEDAHAHNQYLHTASELGIPGLAAYLAVLVGIFWMTAEVRRSGLPDWMRTVSRGVGAGQLGFAVFGLVDAVPLGAKPGLFFWVSAAIVTAIYLHARNGGLLLKSALDAAPENGPRHLHG